MDRRPYNIVRSIDHSENIDNTSLISKSVRRIVLAHRARSGALCSLFVGLVALELREECVLEPESIVVFAGLEGVRRRPGMYIGGLGPAGLHQMLWELVGNAVDEHLRGHASYLRVTIDGDAISVEDDGRGVPVDPHPHDTAKSILEVVLTVLHAGSPFRPDHVHVAPALF